MQIHNTVLALQMMNGVKVYAVRFIDEICVDGEKHTRSSKTYHYKSAADLEDGTWVVVPVNTGKQFALARIEHQVFDPDLDAEYPLRWINQVIDNPLDANREHLRLDKNAQRKLAESQVIQAARVYLATLGRDATAFSIEALTNHSPTVTSMMDDDELADQQARFAESYNPVDPNKEEDLA